ncbi:MAG: hypothetical protein MJA29_05895, partial [Candidatus Omnitrophica bacterium]|nr:hypothetical protein [Candidatus Omnitrophota bacterium]
MYRKTHTKRGAVSFRILSIFCALAFAASGFFMLSLRTDSCSYAYTVGQLPAATEILKLTPAFTPATLRGISVDPMNPLTMEFILDEGSRPLEGEALKAEAEKLSRYFLAALTIPERDFWVNLSVFE